MKRIRSICVLLTQITLAFSAMAKTKDFLHLRPKASSHVEEEYHGCLDYVVDLTPNGDIKRLDPPEQKAQQMRPNVSVEGTIKKDAYEYYQVCVSRREKEHEIFIKLDAISGDPNLYIAVEEKRPTKGHAAWIAQKVGSDKMTLPTYLDDFPTDVHAIPLYIGVYGRTDAKFKITIQIKALPENRDIQSRRLYYTEKRQKRQRFLRARELVQHFDSEL